MNDRMKITLAIFTATLAAMAWTDAQAATYTFAVPDGTGGDWNTAGNWSLTTGPASPSNFPNAIDDVAIIGNKKNFVDLSADATIGEIQMVNDGTFASTQLTSTSGNKLIFDVSSGQAKMSMQRGTVFNNDFELNDDLLITTNQAIANFKGALSGSKDIYVAASADMSNNERLVLGGDLSGFTGDIYLQAKAGTKFAILNTNGLGVGDLTDTTIFMGQDSIIDAARNGGGVVEADIVLQGDALFMGNGNKGGFKTTGVISGTGNLMIDTANGGPVHEIGGTSPNTFAGDVTTFRNGGGGTVILSKDSALGFAPNLNIGDNTTVRITSSGADEDRMWDNIMVFLEADIDNDSSFATLLLDASVEETVGGLFIDNVMQSDGTYGAPGSGADNEIANFFGGSGILNVVTPVVAPVPEPSAIALWVLVGSLLSGYGWVRRRASRGRA